MFLSDVSAPYFWFLDVIKTIEEKRSLNSFLYEHCYFQDLLSINAIEYYAIGKSSLRV
jgi:hypothetical protein